MTYALWRKEGEQFADVKGRPYEGGTLRFYQAGTATPLTVYRNADGSGAWGTSVTLDAAGKLTDAVFIGETSLKERLEDGFAALVWEKDGYPGSPPAVSVETARPLTPIDADADPVVLMVEADIGRVKSSRTGSVSV